MGKRREQGQKCPVCGAGGHATSEAMREHLERDHCKNVRKVQHMVLTVDPDSVLMLEIRGENYQCGSCEQSQEHGEQLSSMARTASQPKKQKDGNARKRKKSSRSEGEDGWWPDSAPCSPSAVQNLLASPRRMVVPQLESPGSGHRQNVSAVEVTPLPFECSVAVTPLSVAQLQGGAVVALSGGNKNMNRHQAKLEGLGVRKKYSEAAEKDRRIIQKQLSSPVIRKKPNRQGGSRENCVPPPTEIKPGNVREPVKPVAMLSLSSATDEMPLPGVSPSVTAKGQQPRTSHPEPQPALLSTTKESRRHMAEKQQLLCEVCSSSVAVDCMARHMAVSHPSRYGVHVCPHCFRQYASARGVKLHIQRMHSSHAKLKCPHCDKVYTSAPGVKAHIKRLHIKPGQ